MKEDEARAWEEARAILRDKDATIERLQARVAELEAGLEKIADGQWRGAVHEKGCFCHRCAEGAGNLRQIATELLNKNDLSGRDKETASCPK